MIRSTEQSTSGALPYGDAVDFITKNMQVTSTTTAEATADQTFRSTLMQEIQELESKIEEVNQLLCRTSLEYMVRFQLKDDLEYYHGLIENKRHQLGA
jgi:predicted RND superfamily exporter protein